MYVMSQQKSIYEYKTPVASWDFRINETSYTLGELKDACSKLGKKWCFQLEEGDTSGYRHYQGRLSLFKKKRGAELAALWQKCGDLPNYIGPTLSQNQGNEFYQQKLDTRIDGPWTNKDTIQFIPTEFASQNLRPWQTDLLTKSSTASSRQVDVIVDTAGNHGKSWISAWCHLHNKGYDIPPIGRAEDLMAAVMGMLMAKEDRDPKIIFVDLPRSMKQDKLQSLFVALESIKKGRVYDFRYAYKEWWFNSPRVWCFMNQVPDAGYLSADRWKLWKIEDDQLVSFT